MKRRTFIKNSALTVMSTSVLTACHNETVPLKDHISGFIISDAHIGWRGQDQPSVQEQSKAAQVIKKKFPNLDLFFDTGDIHHGYLDENERIGARDSWLTHLVNPFSDSLFHYIPGNHELQKGPYDTEITASILGSQNFRPYYSFDYKGIHFISLPQLRDTILISKETLDWLEHDLLINRNKTTLVFSHNSISNTTYTNGESSYREVINSSDVLSVLDKYNNVIAWFHGHNHLYQIVNKQNRLYVSNGRIGGFDPHKEWGKPGDGHLGGIYFEINNKELKVKCFSATSNAFLSDLGFDKLSQGLKTQTSFKKASGMNYYFGHGNLTNNISHNINNYYLSNKNVKILTKKIEDDVLNENSNFELPTELSFAGKDVNRVVGYNLRPRHIKAKNTDEGLLIKNLEGSTILIELPTMRKVKGGDFLTRPGYFRCESGDQFNIELNYKFPINVSNESKLSLTYYVYDEYHNIIFKTKEQIYKQDSISSIKDNIDIPDNLNNKGNLKYLKVGLEMSGFPKEFIIRKLLINKTTDPLANKSLQFGNNAPIPLSQEINLNNSVINKGTTTIKYSGSDLISCIIQIKDVDWQVRNAIASYEKSTIKLHNYSHNYQKIPEVVITPTRSTDFYLNKVVDLMPLEISYISQGVVVSISKITANSKLVFQSKYGALNISGGEIISKENGLIVVVPKDNTVIARYST